MTPDPTHSAHILRPLEHLTGCGERGGNGRISQESFHIMCQGSGWTARAEDDTRKR